MSHRQVHLRSHNRAVHLSAVPQAGWQLHSAEAVQEPVQAGAEPAGGGQCPPSSWGPEDAPALAPALEPEAELALHVAEALAEPCGIET